MKPSESYSSELNLEDKKIIGAGLAVVTSLGWIYILYMAWAMENMHIVDMWMPPRDGGRNWTAWDFLMLFSMWLTMMVAMMTPTAAPMIIMFSTVNRNKQAKQQPYAPTFIFLTGYLIAWALFSILISLIQWPLHEHGLLNPMMNSQSYLMSGIILILAGIYQWTPMKNVCLKQCRTPLSFIMTSWRNGNWGAFLMGLHHGLFCVGCCWALMAILFAVGVMNMLWVILITVLVLLEKILPFPTFLMRTFTGTMLFIWGTYLLVNLS